MRCLSFFLCRSSGSAWSSPTTSLHRSARHGALVIRSFIQNLCLFGRTMIRPHWDLPYNPLLNILGVFSIFWSMGKLGSGAWRLDFKSTVLLSAFGITSAIEAAGLASYAESSLLLPQSSRYFLLGSVILSVSAIFGIRQIFKGRGARA